MKLNRLQVLLVSAALIGGLTLAEVLAPRQLMARTGSIDLEKAIPQQFGNWKEVSNSPLVTPSDPEGVADPEAKNAPVYSQEIGRTYVDANGHIVMLMVAYGPAQNNRLKAHRPEICYTAAGFRISDKHGGQLNLNGTEHSLKVTRLVAEREARYEPISYWMRVGNDVVTGVVDRQLIRLKYGLQGLIPDGALIRVSTLGLPKDASFAVQDQFINQFIASIAPENRKFFTGS
jgi:EpsI family protein